MFRSGDIVDQQRRRSSVAFGRFQVLPDRREVLADGRPC
jgi:hypothetical protein